MGLGMHLGVGEGVFMLSVATWLGKEMIRDSMTRTYIHAVGHFEGDVCCALIRRMASFGIPWSCRQIDSY